MKEETKLKKQKIKDEIRDKYKHYFDLLVGAGGALNLSDFSILLNLDYTKTTRELKEIEEKTNIIKSYTRVDCDPSKPPTTRKVICLTRPGWKYLTGKERNQVKFENETTMNNIRLKAFKYVYLNMFENYTKKFKDRLIELHGNAKEDMPTYLLFDNEEIIDFDEIFKDTKFVLTKFKTVNNGYQLDAYYISNRIYSKKLLEEMDQLLSVLEYIYEKEKGDSKSVNFNINLKCIVRHKPDIGLFIHLKNKYKRKYHYYFTTDMDVMYKQRRSFKTIFKEVYKRVEFFKLEDNYKLRKL